MIRMKNQHQHTDNDADTGRLIAGIQGSLSDHPFREGCMRTSEEACLLGNSFPSGRARTREEAEIAFRRWLWLQIRMEGAVYAELLHLAELARQGDLTPIDRCVPRECHNGAIVARAIEWLNSTEGAAFRRAHGNAMTPPSAVAIPERDYLGIQGLVYRRKFLSPDEQAGLLAEIDRRPWLSDLRRRVQHYGYKYDYRARAINHSMYVGPLPPFATRVAQQLVAHGLVTEFPDQAIVNEYQPGQGIGAHVDCRACFRNTIVTVSLGSACEMEFEKLGEARSTILEPGSALVLRDAARYEWRHRIESRTSDHGIPRGRRVSLTLRNVIMSF